MGALEAGGEWNGQPRRPGRAPPDPLPLEAAGSGRRRRWEPIRAVGVPALRAQPGRSGPVTAQAASATGRTMLASTAAPRRVALAIDQPWASRHHKAARTAATQTRLMTSTQPSLVSEPVPRPCTTATGQQA